MPYFQGTEIGEWRPLSSRNASNGRFARVFRGLSPKFITIVLRGLSPNGSKGFAGPGPTGGSAAALAKAKAFAMADPGCPSSPFRPDRPGCPVRLSCLVGLFWENRSGRFSQNGNGVAANFARGGTGARLATRQPQNPACRFGREAYP